MKRKEERKKLWRKKGMEGRQEWRKKEMEEREGKKGGKERKKSKAPSPARPATHVQLWRFRRESGMKDLSVFQPAEVDFRHV